jgi:glycosyltransferase involved in cell wall biosynthesis
MGNRELFVEKLDSRLTHYQVGPGNMPLVKQLWKMLIGEKPDLVHSHGFTAGLLASLPVKLMGIPHIVTTHDVFHEHQFKGLGGKLNKWLIGKLLAIPQIVNPVGDSAKENLCQTYPALRRNGRVRAIQNGIDVGFFLGHSKRDLREEAGLANNEILLGFFGRFMAQKGFNLLIEVVEQWNKKPDKNPLHVACFGWGGFIREEQQKLSEKNIAHYFHFFPNTDDMPSALRGVDAVVMPSRWEACPLLPMEALTAGVPLIVSDCLGMLDVVDDTPAIVFKTDSVSGMYQALEQYEDTLEDRQMEAKQYASTAGKRFDVNNTAMALRSLFEGVVSSRTR